MSSPAQLREIILASASPQRRELLTQIGVAFRIVVADIDETPLPEEDPVAYTLRLAVEKARTVLRQHPDAAVIGADTTVTVDGALLGKPVNADDARRMLCLLRNRSHFVMTGVAVVTQESVLQASETTKVSFSVMTDTEIEAYIATGEATDKAGAYGIQGLAARWIPRIEGDYTNVVGLPLARVYQLLRDAGALEANLKTATLG